MLRAWVSQGWLGRGKWQREVRGGYRKLSWGGGGGVHKDKLDIFTALLGSSQVLESRCDHLDQAVKEWLYDWQIMKKFRKHRIKSLDPDKISGRMNLFSEKKYSRFSSLRWFLASLIFSRFRVHMQHCLGFMEEGMYFSLR